jgi:hypothetical protein
MREGNDKTFISFGRNGAKYYLPNPVLGKEGLQTIPPLATKSRRLKARGD